jgi:GMP synthase-like glutamine amidotransferase
MQNGFPMRLALLMTNTDESEFAQRHPKDGEKFRSLMATVRPDWKVDVFPVKDGIFPDDLSRFDGVMIGGSPASVHDGSPWIEGLLDLIREIVGRKIPLFGACFGHQAIALALGGTVSRNPGGYVFGSVPTEFPDPAPWMQPPAASLRLHAAHNEAVATLPKGARVLGRSEGCATASFAIDDKVFTTQYHPEITPHFMRALLDELEGSAPADALARGRKSLSKPAESLRFAEWIARFFEQARASA